MVKHEKDECSSPLCKICQGGHHTLICKFEKGEMRDVEPQNKNEFDDDDSFNGDYIKSDQKNIYVCEPREKESNAEEVVKGNHKRSPDVEDENVPEVWEIETNLSSRKLF